MKYTPILLLATSLMAGCAQQTQPITVGGDYRMVEPKENHRHVEISIYGDRTMILPTSMNLYFYDRNTNPIQIENLNGYYLFPTLIEAFYMQADDTYFIVQLDKKTRVYSINQVRND